MPGLVDEGKLLVEKLRNFQANWVLVNVEAGAGHLRQLHCVRKTLEAAGKVPIEASLEMRPEHHRVYAWLQNRPKSFKAIKKLAGLPFFGNWLSGQIRGGGKSIRLEEQISKSGIFYQDLPTILVATHVLAAQTAISLSHKSGWENLILGEFVPDPWRGFDLEAMVSRGTTASNRHLVVVHDRATVREVTNIRKGRNILGLGTLSAPEMMFEQTVWNRDYSSIPPHVGVEFSGNDILKYTQLVNRFLNTITEEIRTGKVRVTIHVMHHMNANLMVQQWMKENGLIGHHNLLVIKAKNIQEAVVSRHEYLVGREIFGKPDVVVTKGGEVPLEDRGATMVACVYSGSPHEEIDIEVGVAEKPGFVKDLSRVDPNRWWPDIKTGLREKPVGFPGVRSRALLGLGMLVGI